MAELKNGELPEYPVSGPFGGIQSEMPTEQIGQIGYADAMNIMFRLGKARVRPAMQVGKVPNTPLLVRIQDLQGTIAEQSWSPDGSYAPGWLSRAPGGGPPRYLFQTTGGVIGFMTVVDGVTTFTPDVGIIEKWSAITDFFTVNGNRVQVATTPSQVFYNTPGGWVRLFGVLNNQLDPVTFAVVGQKLYFGQGMDKVQVWDGISTSFGPASADAVPAKYLFEYGNHLIACSTLEAGGRAYQRFRWTGAGDGTDWTSFDSGQSDLFNDLGPINGCLKLFIYGYIFQQFGIVQMQLTGNASKPFYMQPITSKSKGLVVPRSLAANGESTCYYIGQDNVYMFDGTSSSPVGDMPVQGRVRYGARSRIFADIAMASPNDIFGFVSSTINGNAFNAYWIVIPNVCIWIYHIDDMTWTRWNTASTPTCIGNYLLNQEIRIQDLVGTIAQQQWTPATLLNNNPFPAVMVGCVDGSSLLFDFTGWSEAPWSITTGELDYGDARHEDTTKKVRLTYKDNGPCLIQMKFENQDGATSVNGDPIYPDQSVVGVTLPGTGNGKAKKVVFPVNISGIYTTMQLSGGAGVPFELSSYAPMYSTGGEVRNEI